MRIPINLASRPFHRVRAPLVASVVASVALLGTLAALIALTLSARARLADVRGSVARLNAQVRSAQAEQATLSAALKKPENSEVLERVVFINTLLYRKGISWTGIFSDLEKVLPYDVKLLQIHPTLNPQNQVLLDMIVGCAEPESEIKFLETLENSPLFGEVRRPDSIPPTQSEPLHRYRVMVRYAPKP